MKRARVTLIGSATFSVHGSMRQLVKGRPVIMRGDELALFESSPKSLIRIEYLDENESAAAAPTAPKASKESKPEEEVAKAGAVPPAGAGLDEEEDGDIVEEEDPADPAAEPESAEPTAPPAPSAPPKAEKETGRASKKSSSRSGKKGGKR